MARQLEVLGPKAPPEVKQDVRIQQTKSDGSERGPLTIGIQQHDEAVLYYFDEVIKPVVEQNGNLTPVPVFVGNREIWESVRKQGYYRDDKEKLYMPIITLKRTRMEKNRESMGGKLDANRPQVVKTFENRYNVHSQYNQFNVQQNIKPERQLIHVGIPDYITLTYEGVIQTYYMEQMNGLIEAIEYASDSYWGKPSYYKFMATIDSFEDATDMSVGDDRIVQCKFSIKINGYLLPDITQRKVNESAPTYTATRIVFRPEIH